MFWITPRKLLSITLFTAAAILLAPTLAPSQTTAPPTAPNTPRPLMLITPSGPGAIPLPNGPDWKPQSLALYDNNTRPVALLKNGDITVSYILFHRTGGAPTAQGCLEDVINPLSQNPALSLSQRKDSELQSPSGQALATTTYLLNMDPNSKAAPTPTNPGYFQRNSFAFAGNASTCAEIHLSTIHDTKDSNDALAAILATFEPNLTYQPNAGDYFRLANQYFKPAPASAVPYYKSALATLPNTPAAVAPHRLLTDQLVMALALGGDIKASREAAEKAIATDPDYPMNYYNLACADAEQGNATAAKAHLQQAFDHRANVLKGEHLPDPTKDSSILKLKKDKPFWTFVESLPKN